MSSGEPSWDGESVGCHAGELATLAICSVRFGFARALGEAAPVLGGVVWWKTETALKGAVVRTLPVNSAKKRSR